jgi:HPr kinase/phosphorylase
LDTAGQKMSTLTHGTALSVAGKGVLLRGVPGAGKSSLALRLIDEPGYGLSDQLMRARLVADDQVVMERIGSGIWMSPPRTLAGKLEIRGLGIVEANYRPEIELCLIVDLELAGTVERMPESADLKTQILGVPISLIRLETGDFAAPAKVRAAVLTRVATAPAQA